MFDSRIGVLDHILHVFPPGERLPGTGKSTGKSTEAETDTACSWNHEQGCVAGAQAMNGERSSKASLWRFWYVRRNSLDVISQKYGLIDKDNNKAFFLIRVFFQN